MNFLFKYDQKKIHIKFFFFRISLGSRFAFLQWRFYGVHRTFKARDPFGPPNPKLFFSTKTKIEISKFSPITRLGRRLRRKKIKYIELSNRKYLCGSRSRVKTAPRRRFGVGVKLNYFKLRRTLFFRPLVLSDLLFHFYFISGRILNWVDFFVCFFSFRRQKRR